MNCLHHTKTLVESFNALADEVQSLIDRKTILEHKLRFAHEQYQYLADKYAPAVPEISETLAKLQLPPDLHPSTVEATNFVPLPRRGQSDSQHHIALFIREGRKAAQKLAISADMSKGSGSDKEALSPFSATETMTSLSTVLEQDFTVEGRKGLLECPFSKKYDVAEEPNVVSVAADAATDDPTPHRSTDPICAAMYEETMSAPAPSAGHGSASKCPIRFLDQHSPEEIAQYVEKHKHQIPRSHEVCVRRYQKTQDQIRKIDAKYGNFSSMIKGLSQLHQPMLPTAEQEDAVGGASNDRVETWANGVSVSEAGDPEKPEDQKPESSMGEERESHFDRPLNEVRVGESPSRPWGISIPVYSAPNQRDHPHPRRESSPAAPVRMPSPVPTPQVEGTAARKCPFDHTKLAFASPFPKGEAPLASAAAAEPEPRIERPSTPVKNPFPPASYLPPPTMPTFVNPPPPVPETKEDKPASTPQTVFNITGPVFIGYPMEQAMQFMQNFQGAR